MKELECKATRYTIINTETGEAEAAADFDRTITGYLEACTAAERKPLIVRTRHHDIPASEWMIRHPSPQRHPWTVTVTRIEHLPNGQKSYYDPVTLKTAAHSPSYCRERTAAQSPASCRATRS